MNLKTCHEDGAAVTDCVRDAGGHNGNGSGCEGQGRGENYLRGCVERLKCIHDGSQ